MGLHFSFSVVVRVSELLVDVDISGRMIHSLVIVLEKLRRDFRPVITIFPIRKRRRAYLELPCTFSKLLNTPSEFLDVRFYPLA